MRYNARNGPAMKTPVFLLAFILCGFAATASAATLVVTKTEDTNDGVCDADCSLREAVGHFDVRHGNPCQLYEALTRHPLQQEATEMGIWSKFLRALAQQDKIVFEGAEVERDDADMVIDVATRFVELVSRANKL